MFWKNPFRIESPYMIINDNFITNYVRCDFFKPLNTRDFLNSSSKYLSQAHQLRLTYN